jgi:hypothetical protein
VLRTPAGLGLLITGAIFAARTFLVLPAVLLIRNLIATILLCVIRDFRIWIVFRRFGFRIITVSSRLDGLPPFAGSMSPSWRFAIWHLLVLIRFMLSVLP